MSKDGAEVRKERIQKTTRLVLSSLQKHDGEISLSGILAILKYETGLTEEKIIEYLTIGADTKHFRIENDKIKLTSQS